MWSWWMKQCHGSANNCSDSAKIHVIHNRHSCKPHAALAAAPHAASKQKRLMLHIARSRVVSWPSFDRVSCDAIPMLFVMSCLHSRRYNCKWPDSWLENRRYWLLSNLRCATKKRILIVYWAWTLSSRILCYILTWISLWLWQRCPSVTGTLLKSSFKIIISWVHISCFFHSSNNATASYYFI